MNKKVRLAVVCLLLGTTLACGLYQDWRDGQVTQIAANVFATQTAEAPTPTPTYTPSPTPTPAPTATPTETPAATPTPLPDVSDAVITLEDLPDGFAEMHLPEPTLSEDMGQFQSAFMFLLIDGEYPEMLLGFTMLLHTRQSQSGFTIVLENPELLAEIMIAAMEEDAEVLEQEILAGLGDIGDTSSGVSMVADLEGDRMRIDVVAFQRAIVGAMIMSMHLDGETPVMWVGDAARILDGKIETILASE